MDSFTYDLKEQLLNPSLSFIKFLEDECDDPVDNEKLFIHNYLKEKKVIKEIPSLLEISNDLCSLSKIPSSLILENWDNAVCFITKLPCSLQRKVLRNLKYSRNPYFNNVTNLPGFELNFTKLIELTQIEVCVNNYFPPGRPSDYILIDEVKRFVKLENYNFTVIALENYPNIKFIDKTTFSLSCNFYPIKKEFKYFVSKFINCKEYYLYINEYYSDLNWNLNFLFKQHSWYRYDLINQLKERIPQDMIKNMNLFELARNYAPIELIEYSINLGNSWEDSQLRALKRNRGKFLPVGKEFRGHPKRVRREVRPDRVDRNYYKTLEKNMETAIQRAVIDRKYCITKILANERQVDFIKELKERNLLLTSGKDFFDKYMLTNSMFFGTNKWFSYSEHLFKKILYK